MVRKIKARKKKTVSRAEAIARDNFAYGIGFPLIIYNANDNTPR